MRVDSGYRWDILRQIPPGHGAHRDPLWTAQATHTLSFDWMTVTLAQTQADTLDSVSTQACHRDPCGLHMGLDTSMI